MTDTTQPAPGPDMIAQVGQMLDRIQHGQRLANGYSVTTSDDHTIVVASAILAVAAEIRDLRNVLADLLDATRQPPAPSAAERGTFWDVEE